MLYWVFATELEQAPAAAHRLWAVSHCCGAREQWSAQVHCWTLAGPRCVWGTQVGDELCSTEKDRTEMHHHCLVPSQPQDAMTSKPALCSQLRSTEQSSSALCFAKEAVLDSCWPWGQREGVQCECSWLPAWWGSSLRNLSQDTLDFSPMALWPPLN